MVWMMLGVMAGGFVSGLLAGRAQVETSRVRRSAGRPAWGLAFLGGG